MATKTKRTKRKACTYDPRTEVHPFIWDHYGATCWYLQRVWKEGVFGHPSAEKETVVITQVWQREGNLMYMTQWEHHPDQRGAKPFQHQGNWVYSDPAEARVVWKRFVQEGAVHIEDGKIE
jgi:hypothetical protein